MLSRIEYSYEYVYEYDEYDRILSCTSYKDGKFAEKYEYEYYDITSNLK